MVCKEGYKASLGVLGASLDRPEKDFRTKLRHFILNAILCLIFTRFHTDFSVSRTRGEALWYYKNSSLEPSRHFSTEVLQDAILEPICLHVASQNASESRLRGVFAAILGLLENLLARHAGL